MPSKITSALSDMCGISFPISRHSQRNQGVTVVWSLDGSLGHTALFNFGEFIRDLTGAVLKYDAGLSGRANSSTKSCCFGYIAVNVFLFRSSGFAIRSGRYARLLAAVRSRTRESCGNRVFRITFIQMTSSAKS